MKRKLSSIAAYCLVLALALAAATSCKKDPIGNEVVGPDDKQSNDTIPALSLFSADSVALADTIRFELDSAAQTFIVDAHLKGWTAEVTGNDAGATPWLYCTPIVGTTDRTEIIVSVSANNVEIARTGNITFTQDSTGLKKTVGIFQKETPPMETNLITDSLALIAIYKALDGKNLFPKMWNPKNPLRYLYTDSYGTTYMKFWDGIICDTLPNGKVDPNGRIRHLNFTNADAKGDIPAELGNLRALESFTFVVNRVKGVIPNGLSFAKNLKSIYIRGSWGVTGLPKDIGMLSNLELLDFSGTSVTELPESLGKCAKLIEIQASPMYEKAKEPLRGNLSKAMANKPALKSATFGKTELSGDLSFFKEAPIMTKFETMSNKFSGDMNLAENLKNSTELEYLILDSSPELTGTLEGIKNCQKLITFRLQDSKVGGTLDQGELHLIPAMKTVWIQNNEFTGNISVDFLKACQALNSVAMNKLGGTLPDEVRSQLQAKFLFGDRVCVQKEGFGFTNCDLK